MSDAKYDSRVKEGSSIDEFLQSDQDDKISRPESVRGVGFDEKADDLAHLPTQTSQEHTLDDVQTRLDASIMEKDFLGEAAGNAMKQDEEKSTQSPRRSLNDGKPND
jgi:hypothetical protein